MKKSKTLYVTAREDWRAWLKKNHAVESEVWLVCHKNRTGKPSISYADRVEESLCFGWIDSLVKRVDEKTYVQKFTPRKASSRWSALNKRRARRLIKLGRMTSGSTEDSRSKEERVLA